MEKKICQQCGNEKLVCEFYINGSSKKTGKVYYTKRCKKCHNRTCLKRFQARCENNPEIRTRSNEKIREWKRKNPEKNREHVKKYWEKLKKENPEKYRKLKRNIDIKKRKTEAYKNKKKRFWKRQREELRDNYVRKSLGGKQYNELIPLKREIIRIERLCKEILKT